MHNLSWILAGAIVLLPACSAESGDADQAPVPEATDLNGPPPPADDAALDGEVTAWVRDNLPEVGAGNVITGAADLNGDGTPELFVYVQDPFYCGSGGCNLLILQRHGQDLERLGDLSVSRLPVGLFASSTDGWRDLAVTVHGGGMAGGVARVPFGDGHYASNPTVSPAELSDEPFETVIAEPAQ